MRADLTTDLYTEAELKQEDKYEERLKLYYLNIDMICDLSF